MPNPRNKSPTQIQTWLTEVQVQSSKQNYNYTPTENPYISPPIQPPSFWKKILRRSSNPPNPSLLSPQQAASTSNSTSAPSKLRGKLKGKRGDEEEARTEMYSQPSNPGRRKSSVAISGEEGHRESSLEVETEVESEDDVLRARRERLERAQRLLNANANSKRKDEMDEKEGLRRVGG